MTYVDGYVLPVPAKKLDVYKKMAQKAGKIWKEYGALSYKECVAEDTRAEFGVPFAKNMKVKAGETVIFAFVVFKSRAHRDKVNAKVMKDPRLMEGMDMKDLPFDSKRMVYGGFKSIVEL